MGEITIDEHVWQSAQDEIHALRGEFTVAYGQLQLLLRQQQRMTQRTKVAVDMVRDLHQRMLNLQLEALKERREAGEEQAPSVEAPARPSRVQPRRQQRA